MQHHLGIAAILLAGAGFMFAAEPQFTREGQLVRPQDYREWIYLSTGLGMNYNEAGAAPSGSPNFDNVFVEPSAYRRFIQTGRWPDKTIFALELRSSVSKGSINKAGQYQSGFLRVEFAVKDEKRFPDGWAYFGFRGTAATAAAFPASAGCNACHSKNGAVEHTFVQFYPTLLEVARSKGTLKASYTQDESAAH